MDTDSQPLVTVLLPCYNAERYLRPSLESVLAQSYAHLEVLAIDDGSTDETAAMLVEYASRDKRLRLEPNDGNLGLIRTLNRGVALARGTLIARMDADDVAVPERIEKQVRHFAEHPCTEILSTDVSYIREDGAPLFDPEPYRGCERTLRFMTFFLNPICHPTVMGRREVFERLPYSPDAPHSEDYELWVRMLGAGVIFQNIPERLLRFRPNIESVSMRNELKQSEIFLRTSGAAIASYFGQQPAPAVHSILTARMRHGEVRASDLRAALELFSWMRETYSRREQLSAPEAQLLDRFADQHLANILHRSLRRSASDDSAKFTAIGAALRLATRNPGCIWRLASRRALRRSGGS